MKTYLVHQPPTTAACLRDIDWMLRRLRRLLLSYPERAADLRHRIDCCLDERLRLMRIRDYETLLAGRLRHGVADAGAGREGGV